MPPYTAETAFRILTDQSQIVNSFFEKKRQHRKISSCILKRDVLLYTSFRKNGGLAQLVRASASHAEGRRFESAALHQKRLLSSDKRRFFDRCVPLARNVMCTPRVMCPADVMCAPRVKRNTSHHCDRRERHHCAAGTTSLARKGNHHPTPVRSRPPTKKAHLSTGAKEHLYLPALMSCDRIRLIVIS